MSQFNRNSRSPVEIRPQRVAIYARPACEDDDRLAEQEARCWTHADARGWFVAGVWADVASGRDADRAGLRGAIATLRSGAADAVLATDAARLARDPNLLADLIVEATDAGGRIELVDGPNWPILAGLGVAMRREA